MAYALAKNRMGMGRLVPSPPADGVVIALGGLHADTVPGAVASSRAELKGACCTCPADVASAIAAVAPAIEDEEEAG